VTDRVTLAVAGLGAVAQSVHLPLIARRWDLFELVAVCDLSPSLRTAVGEQYGIDEEQRYADAGRMVAESGADGVVLLTSGSHGDVALRALEAGVGVFCEKPLTFTVAEADALAAAAHLRAERIVGIRRDSSPLGSWDQDSGRFGPGKWCGRIYGGRREVRQADGTTRRVSRVRYGCPVPKTTTIRVTVTYAASPA
jgi:hypothetical protein